MAPQGNGSAFTRRGFIGLAGTAAATTLLAACSTGGGGGGGASGGGGGGTIKFWNMPWGQTTFKPTDEKITLAYKPKNGLPDVSYQQIQWANFIQTFSTATASNTNPAVSSGGGTQAFLFASQGSIQYVDDLVDQWKKNGVYDDFLPGLFDAMKTKQGYAAIPYNLDMRVLWYNKTLMEKAGATPPTDWQSWLDAAAALKKIGVYGYATEAGAGAFTGVQAIVSLMINNGGGLFDENQQPNCVTPANIEAVNFVLEMVHKGYSDPASSTYTAANSISQWNNHKFGLGFNTGGQPGNLNADVAKELVVNSPPTSPAGKKGALYFPNNIMVYKHNPSIKGSYAFLTYYYKNMYPLWTKGTGIGLPPLKSIVNTKEFQANANNVKIIKEWQPISHTWAYPGSDGLSLAVTTVDGTPPTSTFAQEVLGGKNDAKTSLTTLQNQLKSAVAKLKS